ncbi:prepilin-type N-terminal cleavage/methylation domain-containing protein [Anoxybacillus flavithermus]|uniref:prepilin-type N-terminal cleavage/methylation domain-containing protein n=1 Tax=Anoxybacillus flavithermus TaxID=33934 RepID=UPI001868BA31|nr:prepilin-type N-terminal cleavage/methylation domain-containing protein [Anoxybacillus flavithermus]MBE2904322.1 prepilin-type N-terminal cleavage/methylation domain-containing protein [Anoxybacillus flavithermus]MBE2928451.1 prepilin-type N-terminal cleavage/methylation domain-containing protein [Anoxybacillus flavithermus]MBE2955669.1 prepilin-type N-terminal cleavage/methylation domain-containing protein [Anoxybacillus flavithermus]
MLKKLIRNEKGLTLIELLAVIVILGIIAAIAIPSIGGLIDNSKKDAHVANAQQMINAAKIAVTADKSLIPSSGQSKDITLEKLENDGYLETMKDPDNGTYNKEGSFVKITNNNNNKLSYSVKLINDKRGVQNSSTGDPVAEGDLARSKVVNNPAKSTKP